MIGVVSTNKLLKLIPDFFDKNFFGTRAIVTGTVELCPTQHGFVAQGIAKKAGINLNSVDYKKLPYVDINSLKLINNDTTCSLLATPCVERYSGRTVWTTAPYPANCLAYNPEDSFPPFLTIHIGHEQANEYRKAIGRYVRKVQWTNLTVDVYL